jgi:hypothetical protein
MFKYDPRLSLLDGGGSGASLVVLARNRLIGCSMRDHEIAATATVAIPKTIKRNDGIAITNRKGAGSQRLNTIATSAW